MNFNNPGGLLSAMLLVGVTATACDDEALDGWNDGDESALDDLAEIDEESEEALEEGLQGAGVLADTDAPALEAGLSTVSLRTVNAMTSSLTDLIWSEDIIEEFGTDTTSIWRTNKNGTPGSEKLLYSEDAESDYHWFGELTLAFDGQWNVYFVANTETQGADTSILKRVPLGGGAAITLATSPAYIDHRSLVADVNFLFWADAGGIRRAPLEGGAVTTLVATTSAHHVDLAGNYLYYSDGLALRRVSIWGGAATTMVTTSSPISALDIFVSGSTTVMYWGEEGGAVRSRNQGGALTSTYQGTTTNRRVTSVAYDGTRLLWTDCTTGGTACTVRKMQQKGVTTTIDSNGVGTGNLEWDATRVYWAGDSSIQKYEH